MSDEVHRDELDTLVIAHHRFQCAPLRRQLLLARLLFSFSDLLKLRVELRQFRSVQCKLGNAALVLHRHRGPVRHGPLDVVDGHVIAKHRPRVGVGLLDGCADEQRALDYFFWGI